MILDQFSMVRTARLIASKTRGTPPMHWNAVVFWATLACVTARAQLEDTESIPAAPVESSLRAGMYLPLTMAPVDSQRAFVRALGGYDARRGSALFDAALDVTVWGPIALRVAVDYGERADSAVRPSGGARVQALKQDKHGIDLGVGVFYRPEGFTEAEGEIEAALAFGRRIRRWSMLANLVYGQDPEGRERDGEIRLATLYDLTLSMQTGLDLRARFDLGPSARRCAVRAQPSMIWSPAPSSTGRSGRCASSPTPERTQRAMGA